MDLKEYEHFADACFRDAPPPCASLCPFGVETRELAKHLQKGNYRAALRVYQKAVLFPGIVSRLCTAPCAGACVRGMLDTAVDLQKMERACVEKLGKPRPTRYARMKKDKTVAVIGGGLSGLAFAHRMSSWGYSVTVYEKEPAIGGAALREMDPEEVLEELNREFSILNCSFVTDHEIKDIRELDFDGMYIATGTGGSTFGQLVSPAPGVYLGGRLLGTATAESIVHGLRAARAMDNFFRSGRFEPLHQEPLGAEPDKRFYDLPYTSPEENRDGEEALREASRCMLCNCDLCYRVCPVMEKDNRYPQRMCSEVIVTIKPNMSRRTGVRMVNNCTFCGKCREVCPEHIDMGQCLRNARQDYFDSGAMPPAFHSYWLEDMAFSLSDDAELLLTRGDCRTLFYPGCQLTASSPEAVAVLWEKMGENAGIYLGCCGLPARWAGQEEEQNRIAQAFRTKWEAIGRPAVITACPSCEANLKRLHPDMEVISLYRYLLDHPELVTGRGSGPVTVLDPCASATEPGDQQAVRQLLSSMGYETDARPNTGCCGFGGHMYAVDPALFGEFARRRTEDLEGASVTYCANCRDILAARGTDCRHLLEMALGLPESFRPPELQMRRENRKNLKHTLLGTVSKEAPEAFALKISEALLDKMNSLLLLRSQVTQVVQSCEESGNKVYDGEQDIYYGHSRFGTVTIWAAWRLTEGGPELINVYSHRVEVKESL